MNVIISGLSANKPQEKCVCRQVRMPVLCKCFFGLGALLFFSFVLMSCNGGSGTGSSGGSEKALIGTWVNQNDKHDIKTIVFNSDGTMELDQKNREKESLRYGAAAGKMIRIDNLGRQETNIYLISNDGKTLILAE